MPSFATENSILSFPRGKLNHVTQHYQRVSRLSPLLISIPISNMVVRVQIPAGRCVRREGTDSIDPCLKYGCPIFGYLALDVLDTELCELSELTPTG